MQKRPVSKASFKINGAALNVVVNQNRGFALRRPVGAALIAAVVAGVVRAISAISSAVPVTVTEWVPLLAWYPFAEKL